MSGLFLIFKSKIFTFKLAGKQVFVILWIRFIYLDVDIGRNYGPKITTIEFNAGF